MTDHGESAAGLASQDFDATEREPDTQDSIRGSRPRVGPALSGSRSVDDVGKDEIEACSCGSIEFDATKDFTANVRVQGRWHRLDDECDSATGSAGTDT